MNLAISRCPRLRGGIDLPASKSYTIRAFLVAGCGGTSRILGPSDCEDARAAQAVARALGARVRHANGCVCVAVPARNTPAAALDVDVHESGTTLRFVLPLLPFVCATATVRGRGTLVGRPNKHLCATLRAAGLDIRGTGAVESVPVVYKGGALRGGRVVIDGSVSSQFASALMIALPRATVPSRLVMAGETLVSRDYLEMTRLVLMRAGIHAERRGPRSFVIPGGQRFRGLKSFAVPSDLGLAAFFMAAAALVPSDIVLRGRFDDSLVQSDGAVLGFLERMGMRFVRTRRALRVRGPFSLRGGVFSLRDCPDLVPVMAVTAMFAKGPTLLKDIGHARVKESDRIGELRRELMKTGADLEEKKDALLIRPRPAYKGGVILDPRHDHRLAMAFAVLGLRLGVTVRDIGCTAKSYPGFVRDLAQVSGRAPKSR